MTRSKKSFLHNSDGTVAIEGSLFLVFFVICTMGLFEITDYLSYRQKIARSADDLASTISLANNLNQIQALLDIPKTNADTHGYQLSVIVCMGTGQQLSFQQTYKNPTTQMDGCNWRNGDPPVAIVPMSCGDKGSKVNNEQFALVQVSCNYKPIINFLGLFNGKAISSTSYATFRQNVMF